MPRGRRTEAKMFTCKACSCEFWSYALAASYCDRDECPASVDRRKRQERAERRGFPRGASVIDLEGDAKRVAKLAEDMEGTRPELVQALRFLATAEGVIQTRERSATVSASALAMMARCEAPRNRLETENDRRMQEALDSS